MTRNLQPDALSACAHLPWQERLAEPGPPQSSLYRARKRPRNYALRNHFAPIVTSPCAEVRGRKRRSGVVSRFFHPRVLCALARGPRRVLRYPACSGAWRPIQLVVTRTGARVGRPAHLALARSISALLQEEPNCLPFAAVPLICPAFAEVANVHARNGSIHETLRH
jgi:hypothetical protein